MNKSANKATPEELGNPVSHQALADELNLRMDDTFTRVCIAAMYWRAKADYWRQKAKERR